MKSVFVRRRQLFAALVAASMVGSIVTFYFGLPALAASVPAELISGVEDVGKDCATNEGSAQDWVEVRLSDQTSGSDGTLAVTLSNVTVSGFDFTANTGVDAVIVKSATDGANLYRYDPSSEVTADAALVTPDGGEISFVAFCYDVDAQAPTTPQEVEIEVSLSCSMAYSNGEFTMHGVVDFTLTPDEGVESITITPTAGAHASITGATWTGSPVALLPWDYTWQANMAPGYEGDPPSGVIQMHEDDFFLTCSCPADTIDLTDTDEVQANSASQDSREGDPASPVDIPEGMYHIYLASYDDHSESPFATQPMEQWRLTDAEDDVGTFSSPPTGDLPNDRNFMSYHVTSGGPVFVPGFDNAPIWATHVLVGGTFDVNSVYPVCAKLVPASSDIEVEITVNAGCVLDGDLGIGVIEVEISVPDGATVEVRDSSNALVATLTESGSVSVPEGATYTWTTVAAAGHVIVGPDAGEIDVDECTGSIDVVVNGVCQNDVPIISWDVTPINLPGASEVTITWNDLDPSDPLYSSTQPLSGSMVWPGTVVDNGQAVDWAGWILQDGVWVQGSDGYEGTRPSASVSFEVNPTVTVDVAYPGGTPTCAGPPGEIIVEKEVLFDSDPNVPFTFVTGGFALADDTLAHGESSSSGPLTPGTGYSVSEVLQDGWSQVNATCDDGSPIDNIDLGVGEIVTCTFVNLQDSVGASILVTVGSTCTVSGTEGVGRINVTMSVAGGADVVVRDSDGDVVGTLSADGTIEVPEGEVYTWEATPNPGFEFPAGFDNTGSVTIETCSNPDVLPFTGVNADALAALGIVLLFAGGLTLLTGRSQSIRNS